MASLKEDPAVKRWLEQYTPHGARSRLCEFQIFMRWLNAKGPEPLRGLSPSQLVEYQRAASRSGNEYAILDAIQEYIRQRPGTHWSLRTFYSTLRSFFLHNRAPLPRDPFRIRATKPPVKGLLSLSDLRTLINAADLEMKAIYLTLLQSSMDLERFHYFNIHYGKALADHLRTKGAGEPFLIELPGRKQRRDRTPFYTFIGRDALEAWRECFERIRGWPEEGEPIVRGRNGPLTKSALWQRHARLLERLHYIKRGGNDPSKRYGYHLHEIRDVFRSLLHTKAKKDGFDEACAEFWMGHEVDPNNYDKFYMDREYVLSQYRIAEKYLNIVSGPQPIESAEGMIAEILKRKEYVVALAKALREYGFRLEAR